MTNDISALLDALYRKDRPSASLEKVAEDQFSAALRAEETEEEPTEIDYSTMSTEDLAALALELTKSASAEPVAEEEEVPAAVQEELQKVAMDTLGGQIMAHAMVHEAALIKQAMMNGLCRVCKENPMDIEGASICSACQSAE